MISTAPPPTDAAETGPKQGVSENRVTLLRVTTDLLVVILAFVGSYQLYLLTISLGLIDREIPDPAPYVAITILFAILILLVFWEQGLYRGRATILNLWELETAVKGVMLASALLFALLFFLKLESYSRFVLIAALTAAGALVIVERRALSEIVRRLQLRGVIGRRTLIYGCGKTGQLLMKKVVESPHLGSTVVGFLDDHVPVGSHVCCRVNQVDAVLFEAPVLGRVEDLDDVLAEHKVDDLLIASSSISSEREREILQMSRDRDLTVGVVPNLEDVRCDQLQVEDLSAIPVLRPVAPTQRRISQLVKRMFDLLGASALLIATGPMLGLVAILIRLDSPGRILFGQERVGLQGKPFRMYKFRTMRGDTQPYASSPVRDRGPGVTRVGRFLRRTGLDELPQLLNVIRGDMSLVGPRPEMPHLVQKYSPLERRRLQAKPGITGLWQLSADRHAEIHENIEYDLYYVNHQSFLLDVLILLETLLLTFGMVVGGLDGTVRKTEIEGDVEELDHRGPDTDYVLVALDQRHNGRLPESWEVSIPAAYRLADRWPVRIVVSDGNIAALDDLLEETIKRLGTDGYEVAYAPYQSRSELRRLSLGARLVITDLKHVSSWAQEAAIEVLIVEQGGVRWWPRSRVPDPPVSAISEFLTVYVRPPLERENVDRGHLSLTG